VIAPAGLVSAGRLEASKPLNVGVEVPAGHDLWLLGLKGLLIGGDGERCRVSASFLAGSSSGVGLICAMSSTGLYSPSTCRGLS
jgi:hypothetical protein